MVGKAWHQEAWGILEVSKQRKRTGSGARLYNLKACPKWCTSSSKVPPAKGYIICPNTTTSWAPGVYTHDPMRGISFPSHKTPARKHLGFFHSYTACSTCMQTSGIESCLLTTLMTPIVTYSAIRSYQCVPPVPCVCPFSVSMHLHVTRTQRLPDGVLTPPQQVSESSHANLHGLKETREAWASESMSYSAAKGKIHLVKARCHHSEKAISAPSLIRGEKNQLWLTSLLEELIFLISSQYSWSLS